METLMVTVFYFTLKRHHQHSDTWLEVTNEFEIPARVTQLKIVFWKAATYPALFLDDVSLQEKK